MPNPIRTWTKVSESVADYWLCRDCEMTEPLPTAELTRPECHARANGHTVVIAHYHEKVIQGVAV
jgi:polysaccharide deacetylase 2 family uncharacterized protein YibQ